MTLLTLLQSISFDLSITNLLQIGLSALLAGLYYLMYRVQRKQTDIQDTQSDIMKSQTRLMAAEHEPELILDEEMSVDGNSVKVTLSNVGEGRARELSVQCYPFFKNNKGYWMPFSMDVLDFIIRPSESPLRRIERTTRVPVAGESEPANIGSHPDPSPLENGLEAKEESIRFEGEVRQETISQGTSMTVDFTESIGQMVDEWGADVISIDIYVTYADIVDEEHSRHITSRKGIEVEQGMNLEDAFESGKQRDQPVESLVPDSEEQKLERLG